MPRREGGAGPGPGRECMEAIKVAVCPPHIRVGHSGMIVCGAGFPGWDRQAFPMGVAPGNESREVNK